MRRRVATVLSVLPVLFTTTLLAQESRDPVPLRDWPVPFELNRLPVPGKGNRAVGLGLKESGVQHPNAGERCVHDVYTFAIRRPDERVHQGDALHASMLFHQSDRD